MSPSVDCNRQREEGLVNMSKERADAFWNIYYY